MISDSEYLGKYNKKFVADWQSKIVRLINKIEASDTTVVNDIKLILVSEQAQK